MLASRSQSTSVSVSPCSRPSSFSTYRRASSSMAAAVPRRSAALLFLGAAAALPAPPPVRADTDAAELEARLSATRLWWPGPGLYEPQIFYPEWMFGQWEASSNVEAFTLPLGKRFAPAEAAAAARLDMDRAVAYPVRYYSTLPDTFENNISVNLGFLPQSRVIADRAFNTRALTNAVLGFDAVAYSGYDTRSPSTQTIEFATVAPDMRILPPQRAELFISAQRASPATNGKAFYCAECVRQVMVGVRSVNIRDYEIMSKFSRGVSGDVLVQQRVAVYLSPQEDRRENRPIIGIENPCPRRFNACCHAARRGRFVCPGSAGVWVMSRPLCCRPT